MKKLMLMVVAATILLSGCGGGVNRNAPEPDKETTINTKTEEEEERTMRYKTEEIAQALLDQDYEGIYGQLSSDFKEQFTLEKFRDTIGGLLKDVTAWTAASTLKLNEFNYYTWIDQTGAFGLKLGSLPDDEIVSLQIIPLQQFPATDSAKTKHEYALPFKNEWFVFWGGENVLANYHYEYDVQRYAYDLIQVKDDYSYNGDPTKNESYYAFGQEIVAPREGTVVRVVNDIEDNEPVGTMNADHPEGNVVVIDHGDGEYSFLAHMKKGSVVVNVGDHVQKGDLLGLCGNSGNSSEAHLHFQVSDNPDLFEGTAIRVNWENGLSPKQGETLKP
ncbi:M23 family metallopeptidase [Paenibacillus sp. GCM10012307]|uniref:Peptidoglycan DD-metalloendopeptidase family protein n=1 Tax=Paenibacillus roseus TaxID=2798579 RepID=A0A934J3E9_9BACL|nr:M23 family metallopeptidase [Paenibacillus roseus]MBJ6360768.1 peptidoglycan DD-metalloendopeptidase family protein [Paenibacillus roseus]